MTKREFIKAMVDETGLLKEDAIKITDLVFGHMKKQLLLGQEVRMDGVGSFSFRFKKAGTVQNNLVGKRSKVGPRVRLKFKIFPSMQRDLNRALLRGEKE